MRTHYHEFESLEHLLANRLLPGGGDEPIRCVVFGGTGAVGGAAVLELCQLILRSQRFRPEPFRGEIHATGITDKEVSKFVSRLYLALEDRDSVEIEKIIPRRHYRVGGCIDLHFSLLALDIPRDLPDHVESARQQAGDAFDPESCLGTYFDALGCPFLKFVEGLKANLLHAVIVAIPLPSVATYTLGNIDRLTQKLGLDHPTQKRIKTRYLRTFIRGLAEIQQCHARHVVIAHTTAVGGMYRVDGGAPEIRIGFAHSALGKKLVDKKYFADELTDLYVDHGFDVLVTAAAIGIDAVDLHCRLPLDRGVRTALGNRAEEISPPPIPASDLESGTILLWESRTLPFVEESEGIEETGGAEEDVESTRDPVPLCFGPGKELTVAAAIRSGENGLFSVANCVALYNVMKVAIPEELALVLVRHAVFGPERRRDWFRGKICYYTETENSYFALRLLHNYPELVRSHLGAFAIQSYQALGSSTHQARLHELGLLLLLLRLRHFARVFPDISEATLQEALKDLDAFLWERTPVAAFEDLQDLDAARMAELFGALCEVDSKEAAGLLLGYDIRTQGARQAGREKFLARLATCIQRYLQTITSLGLPILYTSPTHEEDRLLVGPYVAPLDLALGHAGDLHDSWRHLAEEHGVPMEVARDWVVVNNGFIDLRAHALLTHAKEPGPHLADEVMRFTSGEEILEWLDTQPVGTYFTTCGLVALELRLRRLFDTVRRRKLQLGTRESWKHLFTQDPTGRMILSPGLVETVRMYSEGLGKVTGTESLWPGWGY